VFEFQPGVVVWTLISFALVYLVVRKAVFPVIRRTVLERRAQIEQSLADAIAQRAEAQAKAAEIEERLGRLRQQEQQILAEAREKAKRLYEEQERKALEDLRLLRKQHESDLHKMREGAFEGLRTAFARTVIEACRKVMRTDLSREQQSRIVDERIAELEGLRDL
jgi:F-type H+-transporting ATPase subunit b